MCIYYSKSVLVPIHIMKVSSINPFQVWMWFWAMSLRSSSSFPMNKFAYAGAILVPMCLVFVEKIVH